MGIFDLNVWILLNVHSVLEVWYPERETISQVLKNLVLLIRFSRQA